MAPTRCARLLPMVSTRCARLLPMVSTRCARLRRACDRHSPRLRSPLAALAIATRRARDRRGQWQAMLKRVSWTVVIPPLALLALALIWGHEIGPILASAVAVLLIGAVLAAVHHAEVVAARVGEPFGSLVLAASVTVIEVALIVTLMASGGNEAATLARDTVFAAVMITMNGIAGLSLLLGSRRYGVTVFHAEGSGAALATLTTLATLSMVLPAFTTSHVGNEFTPGQLIFAAVASLLLYLMFVFTQTVRHRDFFLPVAQKGQAREDEEDTHADPPTVGAALGSLALLLVALVAVVGLAEQESPAIEKLVEVAGFPQSFVGVVIASLVLLPETLAAARAGRQGRIQTSLNLAYGSALASIGLTIPAIALASIWLKGPLVLGLGPHQLALLALTVVISVLTVVPGRATRLQGELHLVILAAYVFLEVVP
jgi:Ca2+:H+ antiporter